MKKSVVARACALLFLGLACTPAIAKKGVEPAPELLAATHGYVFADLPEGGLATLEVQRIGEEADAEALRPRAGEELQRTVGAWLPAGEYRLESYGGLDFGKDTRFEVKAGRVTDLGSFIPVSVGGYDVVVLPVRHADYERNVDAVVRQFAGVLIDPTPIAWTPSRPPEPATRGMRYDPMMGGLIGSAIQSETYRKNTPDDLPGLRGVASIPEFLRRAKQLAAPTTDGVADGAGRTYFPASLGVIRVRAQDGTWSAIDTGIVARIASVGVDGDTLLAGTDDGRILRSNDRGATWSLATWTAGDEIVFNISRGGDQWFFAAKRLASHKVQPYVFEMWTDTVQVYAAPLSDASTPTLLQRFQFKAGSSLLFVEHDVVPRAHATRQAYFVLGNDGVQRYDFATRQWRNLPTPKGKISSFRFDETDATVVAYGGGTPTSKVFLSRDAGETWAPLPHPSVGFRDVQFDANGKGYSFRIDFGPKTERWEVEEYDATVGGDWARTSFLPIRCRPMRVGASAPPLCVTTGSDIYALRDGKWTMEFDAQ